MKIFFEHKKSRIQKSEVTLSELEIDSGPQYVKDLIISLVKKRVDIFNKKQKSNPFDSENDIVPIPLQSSYMNDLSITGKIDFGLRYNDKYIEPDEASEIALQSYKDGLYKLFINHNLLGELGDKIEIKDGDLISVIRLTFLSGRLW